MAYDLQIHCDQIALSLYTQKGVACEVDVKIRGYLMICVS